MTSLRHLSAGCLLLVALAGCGTDVPPPDLIPPAPEQVSVEQLSGTYCYSGPDVNLRSYRRDPRLIPFLSVEALGEPTKVSVAATAGEVRFTYTNRDGAEVSEVFSPAKFRASWQEGALVINWKGVGPNAGEMIGVNLVGFLLTGLLGSNSYSPVLGGRKRESRLFRLADGRLVMADSFRASGDLKGQDMASGAWVREDSVALLLDPAEGDCAAAVAARPPQPWFGKGLDLRVPACADRLEEEFASILVDKGELKAVAWEAAREKVDSLVNERGDWAEFRIVTPSGSRYDFDVGRSGDGCVLRLFGRVKQTGKMTISTNNTLWYLAKRPLPECACVP
ncbi:MAG TPA: hypothetical protein PLB02_01195 [Thermoanaerobaculia bacterium]|nr:hypothetical protein [Thermoanaerobaculia bacterium]HQR65985.1 hypothetical protein [Thermoanaerobaculia bacterium]